MRATGQDCFAFSYEVKMVCGLIIQITELPEEPPTTPWDSVLRNALIEDHLLHARNLIDFFLPSVTRIDDILIEDFLDDVWIPVGPEADRLASLKSEIDKRLAHLTHQRHIEFDGWRSLIITGDLMHLVTQFLVLVSEKSTHLNEGLEHAVRARDYFDADFGNEYRSSFR